MSIPFAAVAIGASAGGIEALAALLPPLPKTFPLPIVVVVHVPSQRENAIVTLFRDKCQMQVREAEDKAPLEGGVICFAPADYHLLVEQDRRCALSSEEPVNYSRPSIDVLLESAADAFGQQLLAVILTGANADGARGLRAVVDAGGTAVIQHPDTALVATMPQAAFDACPTASLMTLPQISGLLLGLAHST